MEFQIKSTQSFLPTSSFPFDREAKGLGFEVRRSSVESLRSAASWLWSLSPCKTLLPVSEMGYQSPAYRILRKSNQMIDHGWERLRFSQVPPSLDPDRRGKDSVGTPGSGIVGWVQLADRFNLAKIELQKGRLWKDTAGCLVLRWTGQGPAWWCIPLVPALRGGEADKSMSLKPARAIR